MYKIVSLQFNRLNRLFEQKTAVYVTSRKLLGNIGGRGVMVPIKRDQLPKRIVAGLLFY